jgi:hypothetical protein
MEQLDLFWSWSGAHGQCLIVRSYVRVVCSGQCEKKSRPAWLTAAMDILKSIGKPYEIAALLRFKISGSSVVHVPKVDYVSFVFTFINSSHTMQLVGEPFLSKALLFTCSPCGNSVVLIQSVQNMILISRVIVSLTIHFDCLLPFDQWCLTILDKITPLKWWDGMFHGRNILLILKRKV